jgi:hypothetical protein
MARMALSSARAFPKLPGALCYSTAVELNGARSAPDGEPPDGLGKSMVMWCGIAISPHLAQGIGV